LEKSNTAHLDEAAIGQIMAGRITDDMRWSHIYTQERHEAIRRLWASGYSDSEIAHLTTFSKRHVFRTRKNVLRLPANFARAGVVRVTPQAKAAYAAGRSPRKLLW
jgi:hypothetical protein